jgi:hypothetical protein
MIIYPTVHQGHLRLTPSQHRLRESYLTNLKDGTRISEELKRVTKSKTHQQIKTIFGLAIATIKAEFDDRGWDSSMLLNLPNPTGNEITLGMLKEYLYDVCPIHNEDGQRITLSHRDCDTKAASKFFDEIGAFAASQWNVYIATPNPDWKQE